MVVYTYVFGKDSYGQIPYFWFVIIFSVVIALLLEWLITIGFEFISLNSRESDAIYADEKLTPEELIRIKAAMGVVAKVLMTLGCILGVALFMHLVLSPLYVIEAIAISLVVWLLIDHRLAPNGPSNGDKPARTAWATARDEGIRAISKGIITFAVFIGIGIVFGSNFQELTLPGVAITLGSGIASPVQKLVHL